MKKEKGLDIREQFVTAWPYRTICEVLREIYWATDDKEIRQKAIDATVMAKRMADLIVENDLLQAHDKNDWYEFRQYMRYELISKEDQDRICNERGEQANKEHQDEIAYRQKKKDERITYRQKKKDERITKHIKDKAERRRGKV